MANIDLVGQALGEQNKKFLLSKEQLSISHDPSITENFIFGNLLEQSRIVFADEPERSETPELLQETSFQVKSYQYEITHVNPITDDLEFTFRKEMISTLKKPITLVLGLPRPRMLRKILELAAVLPLRELIIVLSDLADKSFLLSKQTRRPDVLEALSYGVKQSGIPFCPKTNFVKSQKNFFNNYLPSLAGYKLLGDSQAKFFCADLLTLSRSQKIQIKEKGMVVFIGPERGWSEREKRDILIAEAQPFSLGPETYQVDSSVIATLSQLSLMQSILNDF